MTKKEKFALDYKDNTGEYVFRWNSITKQMERVEARTNE